MYDDVIIGAGARPGILMRAQPRAGTPQYLQGWAPEIDFDDTAKVAALAGIHQQALAMDKRAARKVYQQTRPAS
jgi:hypothetical protein